MRPILDADWSLQPWGPQISFRLGVASWSAPLASDHLLLAAASTSRQSMTSLATTVHQLRQHLDLPASIESRPLERVVAGALRPWLDPLLLDGKLRWQRGAIPTQLLPVLGARDIRGAAAALLGRKPSRPAIRALGRFTLSRPELDLTLLSAAVLGARLDLADEHIVGILDECGAVPRPEADLGQLDMLTPAHTATCASMLRGGDRRLIARLLVDAASTPRRWATFRNVLEAVGQHGAWSVPPLASVERWLERVNEGFLVRHGDIAVQVPLAHTLHEYGLGNGLQIELLTTMRDITRAGQEFDNCLVEGPVSLPGMPYQYFVVRDRDRRGVAIGHLRTERSGMQLMDLLGPSNEPVTDDLRALVDDAVRRCAQTS